MALNQESNNSFSLQSYNQTTKEHTKPTFIIYNIHPNLKICKPSLALSFKATMTTQDDDTSKFILSGKKMKRFPFLQSISNAQNQMSPRKIPHYEPLNPQNNNDPLSIQNNNQLSPPILQNNPQSIQEKTQLDPPIIQKDPLFIPEKNAPLVLDKNYTNNQPENLLNSQESLQNSQKNMNLPRNSQDLPPSILEINDLQTKSLIFHDSNIQSSVKLNDFVKSTQSLSKNLMIDPPKLKDAPPQTTPQKTEVLITAQSRESIDMYNSRKQEFYELNGQNFKNYKYKRYDRELLLDSRGSFGQNLKNKLPLTGARWFPSIESIIEQHSQKVEVNRTNTFEKIREEYFLWKHNLIENREKPREIGSSVEIKRRNQEKTPNFIIKAREKIYENKPKTSDCLLKTVLINKIKNWDLKERDHNSSIHQAKEGDIINCGFKRTFSKKFNVVFHEFQKLLEKERSLKIGFEVVGLHKSIEKGENLKKKNMKNEKNKLKIESSNEQFNMEMLIKSYKFIKIMHEKIRKRVFKVFGEKNNEGKMDFTEFMRFYAVFLQKPMILEKIIEFLIEFLRPKENTVPSFLKNIKVLVKNINDANKKQETYSYLLDILTENKVILKTPQTLDFSLLPGLFQEKKLNPIDIFALITSIS